ncbi:unnamed protein product [Prunus armeniaca]
MSRDAEGGREEEAHAFVTKALASEGKLEGVDMGEKILRASIEGDTEGLVAALLLTLQVSNLLKYKPHGWVSMREGLGC